MSTVLIFGASGGIGRALTEVFAGAGHTVVALARRTEGLGLATPYVLACDITDPEGVASAVLRARELSGPFDVLIYAVGDILSAKVAEMSPDDWRRILDANLTGVYLTVRAALPHLAPKAHLFLLGAARAAPPARPGRIRSGQGRPGSAGGSDPEGDPPEGDRRPACGGGYSPLGQSPLPDARPRPIPTSGCRSHPPGLGGGPGGDSGPLTRPPCASAIPASTFPWTAAPAGRSG